MRLFNFFHFKKYARYTAFLCVVAIAVTCVFAGTGGSGFNAAGDASAYLPKEEGQYSAGENADSLNQVVTDGTSGTGKRYIDGLNDGNVNAYIDNQASSDKIQNPTVLYTLDYNPNTTNLVIDNLGTDTTMRRSGDKYGNKMNYAWGLRVSDKDGSISGDASGGDWYTVQKGYGGLFWTTIEFSEDMMAAYMADTVSAMKFKTRFNSASEGWPNTNARDFAMWGNFWTEQPFVTADNQVTTGQDAFKIENGSGATVATYWHQFLAANDGKAYNIADNGTGDGWNLGANTDPVDYEINKPTSTQKRYLTVYFRCFAADAMDCGIQQPSSGAPIQLYWTNNSGVDVDTAAPNVTHEYLSDDVKTTTTAEWSKSKALKFTITDSGVGVSRDSYITVRDNALTSPSWQKIKIKDLPTKFGQESVTIVSTPNAYGSSSRIEVTIKNPTPKDFSANPRIEVANVIAYDSVGNYVTKGFSCTSSRTGESGFVFERYDPTAPNAPSLSITNAQTVDAAKQYVIAADGRVTFNFAGVRATESVGGEQNTDTWYLRAVAAGTPAGNFWLDTSGNLVEGTAKTLTLEGGKYDIYVAAYDKVQRKFPSEADQTSGKLLTLYVEKQELTAASVVQSADLSTPAMLNGATWSVGGDAGKYSFAAALKYTPFTDFEIKADVTNYKTDGATENVTDVWTNAGGGLFGATTAGTYVKGGAGNLTREFKDNIYITVNRIYIDISELNITIDLYTASTDVKIDTVDAASIFTVQGQQTFEFNRWYNAADRTQADIALSGAGFYASYWDGAEFAYIENIYANDLATDYVSNAAPVGNWVGINTSDRASATLALSFSGKHLARYMFKITLPNGTSAELGEYTAEDGTTKKFNVLYDPTTPQITVESATFAGDGTAYDPSSGAWTSKQVKLALAVTNYAEIANVSSLKLQVYYAPVNSSSSAFSPNNWSTPLTNSSAANYYTGATTANMTLYVGSANGSLKFRAVNNVNIGAETQPQTVKVDIVKPSFIMGVFNDVTEGKPVHHDVWTNASTIRVQLEAIAGESGYSLKYAYLDSYSSIADGDLAALWNSADYQSADADRYFYITGEGIKHFHMIMMSGTGEKFAQAVFKLESDGENSAQYSGRGVYTVKVDRTPVAFNATLPSGKVNYYTGGAGYDVSYPVAVTSTENDTTSPIEYYIGFGADGSYASIADGEWISMSYDAATGNLSAKLQNLSTNGFKTMFVKAVDEAGNVSYSATQGPLTVLGSNTYTLDLDAVGNDARFKPTITINRNGADIQVTDKTGADAVDIFEGDLVTVNFGLSNADYYKLMSMTAGFTQAQLTGGKNGAAQIEYDLGKSAFTFRALALDGGAYTLDALIKTIVNFRNFKWTYQKGATFNPVTYEMYYEGNTALLPEETSVSLMYRPAGTTDAFTETLPTVIGRYDFKIEIADSDATYVGAYTGVVIWTDTDQMSVVFKTDKFVYNYDNYATIFGDPTLANQFLTVKTQTTDTEGTVTENVVSLTEANIGTILGSLTINNKAFSTAQMINAGDYTLVMNADGISIDTNTYKLKQTTIVTIKPMELIVVTGEAAGNEHGKTLTKVYDGTTAPVYEIPLKPLYPYLLFTTNNKHLNGTDITVVDGIVQSSDLTYRTANVHKGTALLHNVVFNSANYVLANGATSAEIPAEITKCPLEISVDANYWREYDTTTGIDGFDIAVYLSFANAVSGEEGSIKLGYTRGYFNSANVADARFITLENLQVLFSATGGVNGNYTVKTTTDPTSSLRISQDANGVITAEIDAKITKKIISSVTWINKNIRKTFDGKGATNLGITFAGLTEIADTDGNGIPDVMEPLFKVYDRLNGDVLIPEGLAAVGDQGRYLMRFVHDDAAIDDSVANYKVQLPAGADKTMKEFVYIIDPLTVEIDFSDSSMQYDATIPRAVYTLENPASSTDEILKVKHSGADFNFTARSGGTTVFRIPDGYSLTVNVDGQGLTVGKSTFSARAEIGVPAGKESAGNIVASVNTTGAFFEILARNIYLNVKTNAVDYSGRGQSNIDIGNIEVEIKDDKDAVLYSSTEGKPTDPLKSNIYSALYSKTEKFLLSIRDVDGNLAQNAGSYYWADADGLMPDIGKTKGSFSVFVVKSEVAIKPIEYLLEFDLNASYAYGSYDIRNGNPFTGDTLSYNVLDKTGSPTEYVGADGVQIIDYVLATLEKTDGAAGHYGNVGEYRIKVVNNLHMLNGTAKGNFVFLNVYTAGNNTTGYVVDNYETISDSGYVSAYRSMTITPLNILAGLDAESYVYGGIGYTDEYAAYADLSQFTTAQLNAAGFKLKFRNSTGSLNIKLLEDGDYNKFTVVSLIALTKGGVAISADNAKGVLDFGEYAFTLASASSLGGNYVITNVASVSAAITVNKYALNVRSGDYAGKIYDATAAYSNANKPAPIATHEGDVIDLSAALHSGIFEIAYTAFSGGNSLTGLDQMINAGTYTVKTAVNAASGQASLFANYEISLSDVNYVISKRPITVDFVYSSDTSAKVGGEHVYNSTFNNITNFDASEVANYKVSFSGFASFASSQSKQTVTVSRGEAVVRNGVTVGYRYVLSYVELSAEIAGNPNFEFTYGDAATTSRYITMLKIDAALSVEISQYYGENYTDVPLDKRKEKVNGAVNDAVLTDIKDRGALTLAGGSFIPVGLGAGHTDTKTLSAGVYQNTALVFASSNLRENPYYNITAVDVTLTVEAVGVVIEAEADMVYGGEPVLKGTVKYFNELSGALIAADFGATPVFDGISAQIADIGQKVFTGKVLFASFTPTGDYKLSTDDSRFKITVNVTPKPVTVAITGGISKDYDGSVSTVGADGKVEVAGVVYDTAALTAQAVGSDVITLTFKRDAGDDAGSYKMYVAGDNAKYTVSLAAAADYVINKATVALGFQNGDATLGVQYLTAVGTPTGSGILKAALDKLDFTAVTALETQIRNNSAIFVGGIVLEPEKVLAAGKYTLSIVLNDNANLVSGVVATFELTVNPYELDANKQFTLAWIAGMSNTVTFGTRVSQIAGRISIGISGMDYNLSQALIGALGLTFTKNGSAGEPIKSENGQMLLDAGAYTVGLYCKDTVNFVFNESSIAAKLNDLTVERLALGVSFDEKDPDSGKIVKVFNGKESKIAYTLTTEAGIVDDIHPVIKYKPAGAADTEYVEGYPKNAGNYMVKIDLNAANYEVTGSVTCDMVIEKKKLGADTHTVRIDTLSSIFSGNEFDKNDLDVKFIDKSTNIPDEVNFNVKFGYYDEQGQWIESDTVVAVGAYDVRVVIDDVNYEYDATFGGKANLDEVFTVNQNSNIGGDIKSESIVFKNAASVFEPGSPVNVETNASEIFDSKYGFEYTLSVEGQDDLVLRNAGTYAIVLTITSPNYSNSFTLRHTYVVSPKLVEVTIEVPQNAIYTGNPHTVSATAFDADNNPLDVYINYSRKIADGEYKSVKGALEAGTYIVTAEINNRNYGANPDTNSKEFVIAPAAADFQFDFDNAPSQIVNGQREFIFPSGRNAHKVLYKVSFNGVPISPELNIQYFDASGNEVKLTDENGEPIEGVKAIGRYTVKVTSNDSNYSISAETVLTVRKARFTDYEILFENVTEKYDGDYFDAFVEIDWGDEDLRKAIDNWQEDNAAANKDLIYFDNYVYYRIDEVKAFENNITPDQYDSLTLDNAPEGVLVALPNNGAAEGTPFDPALGFNDEMARNVGIYRIQCVMEAKGEVNIGTEENPIMYTLDFDTEYIWCTLTIKPAELVIEIIRTVDEEGNGVIEVGTSPIVGAQYRFNGVGEWQSDNKFVVNKKDYNPYADYFAEIRLSDQAAVNYGTTYQMMIVVKEKQPVSTELIIAVAGVLIGVIGLIIGIILLRKKFYTKSRKERKAEKKAAKKAKKQAKKQKKLDKRNARRGIIPGDVAIAGQEETLDGAEEGSVESIEAEAAEKENDAKTSEKPKKRGKKAAASDELAIEQAAETSEAEATDAEVAGEPEEIKKKPRSRKKIED